MGGAGRGTLAVRSGGAGAVEARLRRLGGLDGRRRRRRSRDKGRGRLGLLAALAVAADLAGEAAVGGEVVAGVEAGRVGSEARGIHRGAGGDHRRASDDSGGEEAEELHGCVCGSGGGGWAGVGEVVRCGGRDRERCRYGGGAGKSLLSARGRKRRAVRVCGGEREGVGRACGGGRAAGGTEGAGYKDAAGAPPSAPHLGWELGGRGRRHVLMLWRVDACCHAAAAARRQWRAPGAAGSATSSAARQWRGGCRAPRGGGRHCAPCRSTCGGAARGRPRGGC